MDALKRKCPSWFATEFETPLIGLSLLCWHVIYGSFSLKRIFLLSLNRSCSFGLAFTIRLWQTDVIWVLKASLKKDPLSLSHLLSWTLEMTGPCTEVQRILLESPCEKELKHPSQQSRRSALWVTSGKPSRRTSQLNPTQLRKSWVNIWLLFLSQ